MSVYDEDMGLGPPRWKGEKPGDVIEGPVVTVTRLEGTKHDASKIGFAYELDTGDGLVEWTAWNAHSKRQLAELRPEVGDRMRVTFEGLDGAAANPAMATRLYRVEVFARAARQRRWGPMTTSLRRSWREGPKAPKAVDDALRLATKAERRPPTDADAHSRPSTLPGKPRHIEGQLVLLDGPTEGGTP